MRTVIIGDSFVEHFDNTWLENISNELNLNIVKHIGMPGCCQYYIYEKFKDLLARKINFDLVIFAHTDLARLACPGRININYQSVMTDKPGIPKDIKNAAKMYYEHLYDIHFHHDVHNLLISDLVNICEKQGLKHIHFMGFDTPDKMENGLWFINGLHRLVSTVYKNESYHFNDSNLLNHFTQDLHKKFSKWAIPHIKSYLENPVDKCIVEINPKDFI